MSNIERIRQIMPEYDCNAMLVTNQINRLYATGFASSDGALLVTADDAWFFADPRYIEVAKATIKDAHVILKTRDETFPESIGAVIKKHGITSIGFEDSKVSVETYNEWVEKFGTELVPAQKLINKLRETKSRDDADKMIKAQRLAEKVFNEIVPIISTDITEKDLAAEIIYRSIKNGADDRAFNPIVVSGPNSSRPHGVPGNEKIVNGFLTIDFGVTLDGWCTDTTRTLCVGQPDDEMIKIYDTVLEALESGIKAVHGGVRGADVDAAARSVIENAGYGEFFGHGFGHSLGFEVHEPLRASPTSEDILPAGAVISAEPGIYLPGRYGVRIEDVLYITENGSENITKLPKELIIL